jgi:putative flippase GtrA
MRSLLVRYVKYVGTGLAGSLVETLVLWILSDHVFADVYWAEYVVAPVLSFQCAVAVNFTISYFYVWRDRVRNGSASGKTRFFKLFLKYDLSASAVYMFRWGVMLLIGHFTGWDVVFCNLVAMCFSGIINFLIDNLIIFRRRREG